MLDPEFIVATGFVIFVGLMIYLGVHKKISSALDSRASRIEAELAEAARLRTEAQALLASFEQSGLKRKPRPKPSSRKLTRKPKVSPARPGAHNRIYSAPDEAGGGKNQPGGNPGGGGGARRSRRCRDQSRGSGAKRRGARRFWSRTHRQGHRRFENHVPLEHFQAKRIPVRVNAKPEPVFAKDHA